MKCIFCTKFFNGFLLKISVCVIMPGFANRITNKIGNFYLTTHSGLITIIVGSCHTHLWLCSSVSYDTANFLLIPTDLLCNNNNNISVYLIMLQHCWYTMNCLSQNFPIEAIIEQPTVQNLTLQIHETTMNYKIIMKWITKWGRSQNSSLLKFGVV